MATPLLDDPNFRRTVVLLFQHNEEGAAGVVLNRPSITRVADALPDWADLVAEPDVVFVGGPVQQDGVLCFGRRRDGVAVVDEVCQVDPNKPLEEIRGSVETVRLFAGFAGWGPGQLEFEIRQHAWFVVDACGRDVLSDVPEKLWPVVLKRQPGRLALFAGYPLDPTLN